MNKKIKLISGILIIIVIIIIGYSISFKSPSEPISTKPIKIGAILPLSGSAAFWGENVLNGMNLAVEEINNSGGVDGRLIKVIAEDSRADVKEGVNAANKLLNIDDVFTLITHTTAVSNAVVPLTEARQMPAIFNAADSAIPLNNKYAFKTFYDARKECKGLIEIANKRGINKIGILLPKAMPYAEDCIKGANEVTNNTVDLRYVFRDRDFRTILLKAKKEKVDAMLWVGFPFETNDIHKQRAELGINIPLLCGFKEECISDSAKEIIPREYLNGMISFDFQDVSGGVFGKKYLSLYPETSSESLVGAAFGYDELMVIVNSLKGNKSMDIEKFYKDMMKTENYPSAMASRGFDKNRILIIDTRLLEYKDGNWVKI